MNIKEKMEERIWRNILANKNYLTMIDWLIKENRKTIL